MSSASPLPASRANWKKFAAEMELRFSKPMRHIKTPQEIEEAIHLLTYNTAIIMEECSTNLNYKNQNPTLPAEFLVEKSKKNRIHRQWQRFRDPTTKRLLNAK